MDVALVGARSYLSDALIDKLSKEGDRIYVLTGTDHVKKRIPKVFEQYNFSYVNESIPQIFESIRPDAVIFMGAYDSNFPDQVEQRHILEYSTGLVNILTSLSSMNKKVRFLYLSSEQVFENPSTENYTEESEVPTISNPKNNLIRQGEMTVKNFGSFGNMETISLRLDHLYGTPASSYDMPPMFREMLKEALDDGMIHSNSRHEFSMLHSSDAVDYIYRVMTAESFEKDLYHLSSGKVVNETAVANLLAEGLGREVKVEERNVGAPFRLVLDGSCFHTEFGTRVFDDPQKTLPQLASAVKHHYTKYFGTKKKNKEDRAQGIKAQVADIIFKLIPFIENAVMFIPFFMLNNRATDSQYFANLDFLLLYVLLFAVVFGQQQAAFSGVLATAGYLYRQQYDRSQFDVVLDYNTYVWIAQLFIVGLVVGYIKDRLKVIRDEDEVEIDYLTRQREDISEINTTNVQIKNVLENQIVNQEDSFGKVYSITSSLDHYEPEDVLFFAAEIVEMLVGTQDVAIYTVENSDYARLFAATSPIARSLGNSIKYPEYTDLYEDFINDRVYVNKTMDERYPLMANAIFSEEKMRMIVMVWGIPWDHMNLGQANMLKVIGLLIQNAVVRANNFMDALEQQRYLEGTRILETGAFTSLVRAFLNAQRRELTIATVLRLNFKNVGDTRELETASHMIRSSDYMGSLSDKNYYLLLSNTDREAAKFVIDRFDKKGIGTTVMETQDVFYLLEQEIEQIEPQIVPDGGEADSSQEAGTWGAMEIPKEDRTKILGMRGEASVDEIVEESNIAQALAGDLSKMSLAALHGGDIPEGDDPIDLSMVRVLDFQDVYGFTGRPIQPKPTMAIGDYLLRRGHDYEIAYVNNTRPGTGTLTIEGMGRFVGEIKKDFKICYSVEDVVVFDLDDIYPFTGDPVAPKITVRYGLRILEHGEDYVLSYENNRSIGTGIVVIHGQGKYTGKKSLPFKIGLLPPKAVISRSLGAPTIAWEETPGCDGYQIFRYNPHSGKWKRTAELPAGVNKWTDSDARKKGRTRGRYAIRSVRDDKVSEIAIISMNRGVSA